MTPVKSTAHVFPTWHVLLWAQEVMCLHDGSASSPEALRKGQGKLLAARVPKWWYTLCQTYPHRVLLAQLDCSCSSLRVQGNPPGLAILWMVGLKARVWGLSL